MKRRLVSAKNKFLLLVKLLKCSSFCPYMYLKFALLIWLSEKLNFMLILNSLKWLKMFLAKVIAKFVCKFKIFVFKTFSGFSLFFLRSIFETTSTHVKKYKILIFFSYQVVFFQNCFCLVVIFAT
jgi:hypothetical protein